MSFDTVVNWLAGGLLDYSLWQIVLYTLVVTHLTICGVTLFLHRAQAHRALDLGPVPYHFLRFWLWLTTGMVTKEFVAVHRKHHAKCETVEDPHSPQTRGLRKLLLEGVELYRAEAANKETLLKYGSGTPDDQVRAAAADLLTRLMGSDTFGGTAGAEGPYEPLGFQLFVSPGAPAPADADLGRPPLSWPLATPLASFGRSDELGGSGARVGVVVGAEAAALGPILASASEITPFTSGGQSWTIVVKPLLPDEVAAIGG